MPLALLQRRAFICAKNLDAGLFQQLSFPLWIALLGDGDFKVDRLFVAIVEHSVVEDCKD